MKFIAIIISSIFVWTLASTIVYANNSQLTQEIQPIECVYTTTEDGTGTNTNSSCENQSIPVMDEVIVNQGRPVLSGTYDSIRAIALRVWLNGQWYTLGVDPRLTVNGDTWMLDLSELIQALRPGIYDVVVEVETSDGLLLRNTDAGSFVVPVVSQPQPIQPPTPIPGRPGSLLPGIIIPTILPLTQEASGQTVGRPSFNPRIDNDHVHDSFDRTDNSMMTAIYSVLFVILVGASLWLIRKRWHR